jgi:hypothetical protein
MVKYLVEEDNLPQKNQTSPVYKLSFLQPNNLFVTYRAFPVAQRDIYILGMTSYSTSIRREELCVLYTHIHPIVYVYPKV